jgi:cullin 3
MFRLFDRSWIAYLYVSLRQVQTRFSEEESRAHQYLSLKTSAALQSILRDTLLSPHLQTVIDMASSGLSIMIDLDKFDDLGRLYHLYSLVPEGVPCLRRSLKTLIQERGTEFNSISLEGRGLDDGGAGDEPDPGAKGKGKAKGRPPNAGAHGLALALRWVENVLQLKDKFDRIWELSFKINREVESGLNEVIDISFTLLLLRLTCSRLSSRL